MEFRQATVEELFKATPEKPLPLLPLALDMQACATVEERNHNLDATLARGYVPFMTVYDKYRGAASLVGSGPSLHDTYKELKGDICAINQSIGWLLNKGIVPKWAMIWDADEVCEKFAVPHPEVTYLIASRVHPKVFERLKDCKVVVWHAAGDHKIEEYLDEKGIMEPMVVGGSAGITRGVYLLDALGYRDLHIFGADSSYHEDKTHVVKSLVPEKDILISVGNNPPHWFRTTPEWCAQVNEWRVIYTMFTHMDHSKLTVYGDGMLPYMHKVLEAKKKYLGPEQFMKDMAAQEEERIALDAKASELTHPLQEPPCLIQT